MGIALAIENANIEEIEAFCDALKDEFLIYLPDTHSPYRELEGDELERFVTIWAKRNGPKG